MDERLDLEKFIWKMYGLFVGETTQWIRRDIRYCKLIPHVGINKAFLNVI